MLSRFHARRLSAIVLNVNVTNLKELLRNRMIKHQFDVFLKIRKGDWTYSGSIEAKSTEEAKTMLLKEHPELTSSQVALYPKR